MPRLTRCYTTACNERIPLIARITPTHGVVILHGAGSVHPTHAGARVNAVLVHAGQMARTLGVDHALGLAFDVGVALVVSDAGAGGGPVDLVADGVDAAGRGVARLNILNWDRLCR